MDTTLCYLICLSCLPQTVHTSRDCAVLNVMGQYTVDQDTTAGCCAGRMPRIADACSSCGLDTVRSADVGAQAPTLFPVKMASRPSCAGALREDTEDTGGFVVVVVV